MIKRADNPSCSRRFTLAYCAINETNLFVLLIVRVNDIAQTLEATLSFPQSPLIHEINRGGGGGGGGVLSSVFFDLFRTQRDPRHPVLARKESNLSCLNCEGIELIKLKLFEL